MPSRLVAIRSLGSSGASSRGGDGREASGAVSTARSAVVATHLVWAAALAGTLHAAFSLYWAAGGIWLLDTVGDWAVDLTREQPLLAGLGLGVLGAAKLAAAWVPVLVAAGRVGPRRIWRRVGWVGGLALVVYGGLNTVIALSVVIGLVHPEGGYDSAAMLGHAALWDPLFLAWGLALVGSLWFSGRRVGVTDTRHR